MGSLNNWTKATYTMMGVVKRHLHNFNPDLAFSDLDEAGLSDYVSYLRDVFCFCCFTSLKYSDVANLRRTDVFNDHIALTTIKTADTIRIELNDYSREILDKYKDAEFPGNLVLPIMSNPKMNDYLKEVGKACGIDIPITITYYTR